MKQGQVRIEACKLGCVVRMVVDSILPHAKSRPNDHRKDAPPFSVWLDCCQRSLQEHNLISRGLKLNFPNDLCLSEFGKNSYLENRDLG